jgi:hypothetical protein
MEKIENRHEKAIMKRRRRNLYIIDLSITRSGVKEI